MYGLGLELQPPNVKVFAERFVQTSNSLTNWDTALGFHVPCCKNQGQTLSKCKQFLPSVLNEWHNHANITVWQR